MDPITGGLAILGLGLQIFGASKSSENAKQQAALSQQNYQAQVGVTNQITGVEQDMNAQRKQAMLLSSQRQQLEIVRNSQRARSMALNAAAGQGANLGSGLQGGYGQISGQSGVNSLGISQNTEIGLNMFSMNDRLSSLKAQQSIMQSQYQSQQAALQGDQATNQGISSIGSSIFSSSGTLGNLNKNATSGKSGGMFFQGDWSFGE